MSNQTTASGEAECEGRGGATMLRGGGRVITCTPQPLCSGRARPRTDSWPCPRTPRSWWRPWCGTLRNSTHTHTHTLAPSANLFLACRATDRPSPTFSLLLLQPLPAAVDGRHLRLEAQVVLPHLLQLVLQEGDPLRAAHAVQLTWRRPPTTWTVSQPESAAIS